MQRVKNVGYDDDDLYDDEYDEYPQEDGPTYSAEDKESFATLTPVIRAELEEAGAQASDKDIEDALWHYYWDVGKSVAYLKNSKISKPQQQSVEKAAKPKTKSKFDEAAEKSAQKAGTPVKRRQSGVNGLAKKTEALKLDGVASTPSQPNVRSKGLDVPKLWAEEKSRRKVSAAFVVIGHVDHGKSTLMGRLLLDTGAVAQRDVDKYQKQATEMGKSSFALAWVMDTGTEERERGVTVDIAQHHFSTNLVDFTILDAPGHRDFVPNMIGGAAMADLAVLVVDANQLESGMKGQTREHVLLAKAVGLKRIVVAVNKLDSTAPEAWSRSRFESVKSEVLKFLRDSGFAEDVVSVVPCSGLSGENVAKAPKVSGPAAWVANSHPTLLKALESSVPPATEGKAVKSTLRMQISDVFRGGITNPISISGRMSAGNAQAGDTIIVQPSGETATIKALEVNAEARDYAFAGQICTLHLTDIDPIHLRTGDLVCAAANPVPVIKTFTAKIEALESLLPQAADVHLGRLHVAGGIKQLVSTVDGEGEVLKKKPRMVKAGQRAIVKVGVDEGVAVEVGNRIVLRAEGTTVGFGVVDGTV